MNKSMNKQHLIIDDEQIIEWYWQRSERAIKATDDKYGTFLYKIAFNILHNKNDCEECQNDTYLDIWNAIPPTKPTVFRAFISSIMRRIAIDRYKEKNSKKRIPSEMTVSLEDLDNSLHNGNTVSEEYEAKEIGRIISEYLKKQSDKRQYIFVGRFYLAEPVRNIAGDMGITVSAVYKEIDSIKKGLKKHLESNGIYI